MTNVEIKAVVRFRDDYRCTECGMSQRTHLRRFGRQLDVHRMIPGSRYAIADGVCTTLCRPCHERKPRKPPAASVTGEEALRELLRRAIRESGYSLRKLARLTGVGADRLCRFVRRKRDLSFKAAERVAAIIGAELVLTGRRRGPAPRAAAGNARPRARGRSARQ